MAFPLLLSPGRIGALEIRNRIIMAPMGTNQEGRDGRLGEAILNYYEERARGGVGLVTAGVISVSWPEGACNPRQAALSDDRFLPDFVEFARRCRRHGARAAVQLQHAGKVAQEDIACGRPLWVPSLPRPRGAADLFDELSAEERAKASGAFTQPGARVAYHEMDEGDIARVVEQFASAAARAQQAGIDAVELHAGHGYLLQSFLSPASNFRNDEYGGPIENRARLLTEVLRAVRERCGEKLALWCRIDAKEFRTPGGIRLEDAVRCAQLTQQAGADAVHVSAYADSTSGEAFTEAPLVHEAGGYLPFAAAVKAQVSFPVIAVGRIEAEAGERALREGEADFIAMGRKLLADPYLPKNLAEQGAGRQKPVRVASHAAQAAPAHAEGQAAATRAAPAPGDAAAGHAPNAPGDDAAAGHAPNAPGAPAAEPRPCIYSYECVSRVFLREASRCTVNPYMGREGEFPGAPAAAPQRILVVGGGPAGLEFSRAAALRGHSVTLLEQEAQTGGRMRLAAALDSEAARWVAWLEGAARRAGVQIRLRTRFDPDAEDACGDAQVLVLAQGAQRERSPDFADALVIDAEQCAALPAATATLNIALLGGDVIGVKLAEALAAAGHRVTLFEGVSYDAPRADADTGRDTGAGTGAGANAGAEPGTGVGADAGAEPEPGTDASAGADTGAPQDITLAPQMALPRRWRAAAALERYGVQRIRNAGTPRLAGGALTWRNAPEDKDVQRLVCDHVIWAAGLRPQADITGKLRARGVRVHRIGDEVEVAYLQQALLDAARLAAEV